MEMNPIDERIQRVFREVFDDDNLIVNDSLSPATLPAWDSFAQVRLMIGLQEEFEVQFATQDAVSANSVSAIRSLVASRR
jgi:acyl carrier protein